MTRALILAVGLVSAVALGAGATDDVTKPAKPAKEQKAAIKELREKYDKDKDGKLSKEERGAISAEDKAKLKEFRTARKKSKGK